MLAVVVRGGAGGLGDERGRAGSLRRSCGGLSGTKVAFVSQRGEGGGQWTLAALDPDGNGVKIVTAELAGLSCYGSTGWFPHNGEQAGLRSTLRTNSKNRQHSALRGRIPGRQSDSLDANALAGRTPSRLDAKHTQGDHL